MLLRAIGPLVILVIISTVGVAAQPAEPASPTASELLAQAADSASLIGDPQERAIQLSEVAALYVSVDQDRARALFDQARYATRMVEEPLEAIAAERGVMIRWAVLDRPFALERFRVLQTMASTLQYRSYRCLAERELGRALLPLDEAFARDCLAKAREEAAALESPLLAAAALREVAAVVATLDPALADQIMQQAVELLDSVPADDPGKSLERVELAGVWASWNPAQAQAQAEQLSGDELDMALLAMVRTLAPADGAQALAIANQIVTPAQRALGFAVCAANLPAQQSGMARALAEQARALGSELKEEDLAELQRLYAGVLAISDPQAAVTFAGALPDQDARAEALGAVAAAVAGSSPDQAIELLSRIEITVTREQATVTVVGKLAKTETGRAQQLALSLRNPRRKTAALLEVARQLGPQPAPPDSLPAQG